MSFSTTIYPEHCIIIIIYWSMENKTPKQIIRNVVLLTFVRDFSNRCIVFDGNRYPIVQESICKSVDTARPAKRVSQ